jgi:DNA-binding FadR family transcriptional regulator
VTARFRWPRRDASEQVAFEIRRHLAARELRPGERLGTERELVTSLDALTTSSRRKST